MRRYIELIKRVATDAAHMELTKDTFYDLYNMALLLLKSVDSLDPDKTKKSEVCNNNDLFCLFEYQT